VADVAALFQGVRSVVVPLRKTRRDEHVAIRVGRELRHTRHHGHGFCRSGDSLAARGRGLNPPNGSRCGPPQMQALAAAGVRITGDRPMSRFGYW
jgi:hypothetical protein